MKRQIKFLNCSVILIMLLTVSARGNDYPWPKYKMIDFDSFSAYFDAMIPHFKVSLDPSNAKAAYDHFGAKAFPALKAYLANNDYNVRFHAYMHLLNFIWLAKTDVERQSMYLAFIQGLNDPEEGISQYVARRMNTFGEQIFTEEARRFIYTKLKAGPKNYHSYQHVILAAGMLRSNEVIPILKGINDDFSRFALARMGDKQSLNVLLAKYPTEPMARDMEGRLYWKLKYLAYTKQPEAIDLLIKYLYSDAMQPGGEDYPPEYLAGWAAETLTELIGDSSVKDYEGRSSDNIERCRAWVRKNYKKEEIQTLFQGEIRRWD